jgi:SRSO17 transposase
VPVDHPTVEERGGHHALLVRRRIADGELAYYRCWSPRRVPLLALIRVTGIRWSIEECFHAAKGEVGLDQHQVRTWHAWHRYTTLAMLAHAILAAIVVREKTRRPTTDRTLICLSVNEIRHLCQRTRVSPRRRPPKLPTGGHGFSPLAATKTPEGLRWVG